MVWLEEMVWKWFAAKPNSFEMVGSKTKPWRRKERKHMQGYGSPYSTYSPGPCGDMLSDYPLLGPVGRPSQSKNTGNSKCIGVLDNLARQTTLGS